MDRRSGHSHSIAALTLTLHKMYERLHSTLPSLSHARLAAPQELFESLAKPLVSKALTGYNGTVFAYGQTGSGKTHTMMGDTDDPGIIPQLNQLLFRWGFPLCILHPPPSSHASPRVPQSHRGSTE